MIKMTDTKRMRELLAYACVCFKNMTNPFETMHLQKMNVRLDECGDLSEEIASLIEDQVSEHDLLIATKLFEETQH
jgi:hypothetical protein